MPIPRRRWDRGFTIIELLVATAIALIAATVVIQVLVTTVRTTDQTSSQADVQSRARSALRGWEQELRDGYAILPNYTAQWGTDAGTVYRTTASDTERVIVAAIPSVDTNGAPCTGRNVNVVFDCVIWQAERNGEGADATWDLTRTVYTDAFRMGPSAFVRRNPDPDPFRSLIWGQTTGSSSSSGVPYTVPTMGRQEGTSTVFSGATDVTLQFLNRINVLLAPSSTATDPPPITPAPTPLPFVLDATKARTTPVSVTDVASIVIALKYQKQAATLESGKGEVTQSDTQSVTIRLRNKPTWPGGA